FQLVKNVKRRPRRELVRIDLIKSQLNLRRGIASSSVRLLKFVGEEWQVLQRAGGVSGSAVLFLKPRQHFSGTFDHRRREASKFCHLNAVGAIGGAGPDLVQEYDFVLPFFHVHGDRGEVRQPAGKGSEFVVVGGEKRPAPTHIVQVFHGGPGNRQSVESRRAAPDFVEDDE